MRALHVLEFFFRIQWPRQFTLPLNAKNVHFLLLNSFSKYFICSPFWCLSHLTASHEGYRYSILYILFVQQWNKRHTVIDRAELMLTILRFHRIKCPQRKTSILPSADPSVCKLWLYFLVKIFSNCAYVIIYETRP